MHLKLRRKNQPSQVQLNAGILKDKAALKSLAQSDVILPEFKNIRGSPQYWLGAKRDLFATLRQLGKLTFFLSFFMADTRLLDLRIILTKTVDNIDLTEEEALEMTSTQVCRLIRLDPVTCSRHFSRKVELFTSEVLEKCPEVIGGMSDYFQVTEFQQRGTPHIHMMAFMGDFETRFSPTDDPEHN